MAILDSHIIPGAGSLKQSAAANRIEEQAYLRDYMIRRAHMRDLDDLFALAALSGPGFTSLPVNRDLLKARLDGATRNGSDDHLLMLVHKPSGKAIGCSAIKARSGLSGAHWNFRLSGLGASGGAIARDTLLVPTQAFQGASELGSLFLHPDHRLPGVGRFLSLARLMLIAAFPTGFSSLLWSELRGVVSADAGCPFYDAVMAPRLGMPFKKADKLYALEGSASLLDHLPRTPVRVGDLPKSVQDIIAQTHEAGRGARRILEGAGFAFSGVVDLFDGGPIVAAMKEDLSAIANAQRVQDQNLDRSMVADFTKSGDFECQLVLGGTSAPASTFGATSSRLFSGL